MKILRQYLQAFHANLLTQWIVKAGRSSKVSPGSAMVFSPHQDDETLGCGGLISLKREQGTPVTVVFLTDGGGLITDPEIKQQLIETRKLEAKAALDILGVSPSEIYFLDYPDGTLQQLLKDNYQQILANLVELLSQYRPEEVYLPHAQDRHPDHEATYQLVQKAILESKIQPKIQQYPIWCFWKSPLFLKIKLSDIKTANCLDISSILAKKQAAIAAYESQCSTLPQGFLQRFQIPYEIFWTVSYSARLRVGTSTLR